MKSYRSCLFMILTLVSIFSSQSVFSQSQKATMTITARVPKICKIDIREFPEAKGIDASMPGRYRVPISNLDITCNIYSGYVLKVDSANQFHLKNRQGQFKDHKQTSIPYDLEITSHNLNVQTSPSSKLFKPLNYKYHKTSQVYFNYEVGTSTTRSNYQDSLKITISYN